MLVHVYTYKTQGVGFRCFCLLREDEYITFPHFPQIREMERPIEFSNVHNPEDLLLNSYVKLEYIDTVTESELLAYLKLYVTLKEG